MEARKANLFLVGAMKAGTTSFMDMLSQHPEIYTSPVKEPHFFVDEMPRDLYEPSKFFDIDHYFEKEFPKSLHIAHITKLSHYEQLFSISTNEKYKLEGSTMYLHAPGVSQRIYDYNPTAKIVVLLRNPLQRAFSHYNMLVGLSRETRSFESVLKSDIESYYRGNLAWFSCLGMSFYTTTIERFKKIFREVYIVKFEDVIDTNKQALNGLLNNLGLEPIEELKDGKTNRTRKLRFKWLFYGLKKLGLKDYFSAIFSSGFKQKVFKMVSSSDKTSMKLSPETLSALDKIFKKESSI
jgi:hypothetical protein